MGSSGRGSSFLRSKNGDHGRQAMVRGGSTESLSRGPGMTRPEPRIKSWSNGRAATKTVRAPSRSKCSGSVRLSRETALSLDGTQLYLSPYPIPSTHLGVLHSSASR